MAKHPKPRTLEIQTLPFHFFFFSLSLLFFGVLGLRFNGSEVGNRESGVGNRGSGIEESPLHPAPGTLLLNAFIDAVIALLHSLVLFLPPFWCGGLCAAHGMHAKSDKLDCVKS